MVAGAGFGTVRAALPAGCDSQVYAEASLAVTSNAWQRLEFTLTPSAQGWTGWFALKLKRPGSVVLGHAFLQPGRWGRFKGLPVRRDVAEGLIHQGIAVLRYGGSMVNKGGYKWKKMIGPRDAMNTAGKTGAIVPRQSEWKHQLKEGTANRPFPPHSLTVIRFE